MCGTAEKIGKLWALLIAPLNVSQSWCVWGWGFERTWLKGWPTCCCSLQCAHCNYRTGSWMPPQCTRSTSKLRRMLHTAWGEESWCGCVVRVWKAKHGWNSGKTKLGKLWALLIAPLNVSQSWCVWGWGFERTWLKGWPTCCCSLQCARCNYRTGSWVPFRNALGQLWNSWECRHVAQILQL